MSTHRAVKSLSHLVQLRQREVDRFTVELASKQVLRRRYLSNLDRMEQLLATASSSDMGCPILSSNSAHYKSSLVDMIRGHRADAARLEVEIAVVQRALATAVLKHKSLEQVLQNRLLRLQQQRKVREQKQQDQLATQVWSRTRLQSNGATYPVREHSP